VPRSIIAFLLSLKAFPGTALLTPLHSHLSYSRVDIYLRHSLAFAINLDDKRMCNLDKGLKIFADIFE
jgi:hypothetical protein